MLVLTRKTQERIHIGENVTITIVRIKGNTVRIGIEAPGDVRVMRGEIQGEKSPASLELSTGEFDVELAPQEATGDKLSETVAFTQTRFDKPTAGATAPLALCKSRKFAAAVPAAAV